MSAMDLLALVSAVPDPELPFLTIADLGILRSVSRTGTAVRVTITPTYSGCPAMAEIRADITSLLRAEGIDEVVVDTVLSPAWTTNWMSERGREALAEHGIAPPGRGPVPVRLTRGAPPACPRCGTKDTEELSRFGSTACKALHRCRSCREPFELFKQH